MAETNYAFPEVIYSSQLIRIWEEVPEIKRPIPAPPKEPKFKLRGGMSKFLFYLFAMNIVIVLIVAIGGEPLPEEVVMYLGLCIAFIVAILIYNSVKYQKPLQEAYEKEMHDYHESLAAYEQEKRRLLSDDNVAVYRKNRVKQWLKDREQGLDIPDIRYYNDSDDVREGKSERLFYKQMMSKLPYMVSKDIKVPVGSNYYYPDIVVVANGLFIDIEIDEPYTDEDGQPIHYVEESSGEYISVDDYRNQFMSDAGWEIIRFAEEQVVKQPQKCINYINKVINSILNDGSSQPNLVYPYQVKKWTKGQAEYYALERYRNSYTA